MKASFLLLIFSHSLFYAACHADDSFSAEKEFVAAFAILSERPDEAELRDLVCWDRVPASDEERSRILGILLETFNRHPQEVQIGPPSEVVLRSIQFSKENSGTEPNLAVVKEVRFTLDPPAKKPRTYQCWAVGAKGGKLALVNYIRINR